MDLRRKKSWVVVAAVVLAGFGLSGFLGEHSRRPSLHIGSACRDLDAYVAHEGSRNHRTGLPPFKRTHAFEAASQNTGEVVIATDYYLRPKHVFASRFVQVSYWTNGVNDITTGWVWTWKF
jgi:hypothetical protein